MADAVGPFSESRKEELMSIAPSGGLGCAAQATPSWESQGGVLATPRAPAAPRHIVRSGKRAEDTAAGCRANARADLLRARAPGGDFMRLRLEHSAAVWSERADLLARLEKKSQRRTGVA
jgi:hypothetical protein